jgi:LPS sulfotransferase NodH
MYNVTKLPVVILSSPRTGSTILAHDIKEELEKQGKIVNVYNEPMGSHEQQSFLSSIGKENYILKVHAHDLYKYPEAVIDMITKHDCFLVRIRRRNLEDQILSCYIAMKRNVWGFYSNQTDVEQIANREAEEIEISQSIRWAISFINQSNKALDNFEATFDLDLFYEDLSIKSNYLTRTPNPKNHAILKKLIKGVAR